MGRTVLYMYLPGLLLLCTLAHPPPRMLGKGIAAHSEEGRKEGSKERKDWDSNLQRWPLLPACLRLFIHAYFCLSIRPPRLPGIAYVFGRMLRPQLLRHGLDILAVRQGSRLSFVISLLGLVEAGELDHRAVSHRISQNGILSTTVFLTYTARLACRRDPDAPLHHRHPLTRIGLVPSHSHTSGSHPLAISAPQQGYCQYITALSDAQML